MLIAGMWCCDTGAQLSFNGSVAVVGNGGCLLEKKYGSFIDSHDHVVRFNNANTVDYIASTGIKTTELVINCHVYNNADLKAEGFSAWKSNEDVFSRHQAARILYVNTNMPTNGRGPVPKKNPFYIMEKKIFDGYQYAPLKLSRIPTVGYAFVLNLIRSKIKPNLFGFTVNPDAKWDHYFEDRPHPSESHSHSEEMNNLLYLYKKQWLNLYT